MTHRFSENRCVIFNPPTYVYIYIYIYIQLTKQREKANNNGVKCLYPPVLKCIGHSLNWPMSVTIFCPTKQICSIKRMNIF